MTKIELCKAIEKGSVLWSAHALKTMMERDITREAVKHIISTVEIIEEYPGDKPFPSALILGFRRELPLHAVVAYNLNSQCFYVVAAYVPDEKHFEAGWKTRRIR